MSLPRACTWIAGLLLSATVAAEQLAGSAPPVFERRPLSDFQRMLDRPLFNANRRPEASDEGAGTSSAEEQQLRETWRLTGVVLKPGLQRALFTQAKGGTYLQLEPGMVLDRNWQVEEITAEHVVLARGERRLEMLLYDPAALPPPPPLPAEIPPPQPAAEPDAEQPMTPATPG